MPETRAPIVVDTTLDHVAALATRLRPIDLFEIAAVTAQRPFEALFASHKSSSLCRSVLRDGTCVAIFGVVPAAGLPGVGCAWMLASDDIRSFKSDMLFHSKPHLDEIFENYEIVYNHVSEDNRDSLRWLKYIGFEKLYLERHYGMRSRPFWLVAKCRDRAAAEKWSRQIDAMRARGSLF